MCPTKTYPNPFKFAFDLQREAESYLSVSGVQECSSLRFIPKKNSLRLITLPAKGAKAGQKVWLDFYNSHNNNNLGG